MCKHGLTCREAKTHYYLASWQSRFCYKPGGRHKSMKLCLSLPLFLPAASCSAQEESPSLPAASWMALEESPREIFLVPSLFSYATENINKLFFIKTKPFISSILNLSEGTNPKQPSLGCGFVSLIKRVQHRLRLSVRGATLPILRLLRHGVPQKHQALQSGAEEQEADRVVIVDEVAGMREKSPFKISIAYFYPRIVGDNLFTLPTLVITMIFKEYVMNDG